MYENLQLLASFFMSIAILFCIGATIILLLMFHELREIRKALDLLVSYKKGGGEESEKNE